MKYFICYSILLHRVNVLKNIVLDTSKAISEKSDIDDIEELLADRITSATNNEFNLTSKDISIINIVKLNKHMKREAINWIINLLKNKRK